MVENLELTVSQIITIVNTFISSDDVFQLVDKLSKLDFCDLDTAADVLMKRGYITAEDKEYILGTNVEIRRTNNARNYRE